MENAYIAVLDSGVGGLTVLKSLTKELPQERFLYFGDNFNAPYGNKTERDLLALTVKNLLTLSNYNLKALVVACNTLSVTLFKEIIEMVDVPCFGVFPPVERCEVENKKTLLLSTVKTAEKFCDRENLTVLGLPDLVKDIENNLFRLQNVDMERHVDNRFCGFDTVVLGCTHFELIKNKIFDHLRPEKVISGNVFTTKRVKEYFKNTKSLVNDCEFSIEFVGKSAKINQEFWRRVVKELNF